MCTVLALVIHLELRKGQCSIHSVTHLSRYMQELRHNIGLTIALVTTILATLYRLYTHYTFPIFILVFYFTDDICLGRDI